MSNWSGFSRPRAQCSAATSRRGGRRKTRRQESRVYAAADRVISGGNSSARVDSDPMCLTTFGDDSTKPLALPRRDDALVDKGAAAKVVSLPHGDAHANKRRWLTSCRQSLFSDKDQLSPATSLVLPDSMEGINLRTPIQYAKVYSSFWKLKVFQTKTRQTLVFNPGAVLQVVYAPARFWEGGTRCFVGKFSFGRRMVSETGAFSGRRMTWNITF